METSGEIIFIKTGTSIARVYISDILSIESEGNYCTIKTDANEYVQRSSLIRMKEKLANKGFIQINKSTLVQINSIDHIDLANNSITIEQQTFSLSRNYRKEVIERLDLL